MADRAHAVMIVGGSVQWRQLGMDSMMARCPEGSRIRAICHRSRDTDWGFSFETQLHVLCDVFACVPGAA